MMMGKPDDLCDRTFQFARDIVRLCLSLSPRPGISGLLCRQLVRAGTLVGAHVAEARTADSRFVFVTKTSQARVRIRTAIFWLRLIDALHISEPGRTTALLEEARQLQRILTAVLRNSQEEQI
jgi:four helix bundle protein